MKKLFTFFNSYPFRRIMMSLGVAGGFLIFNFSFAQPTIQWQKSIGGSGQDYASVVEHTTDGGFIVCGSTNSNDGDVTGNHGGVDYWLVKLDSIGNIQWQKCLGGGSLDSAYAVQQTSDGGFIIAGKSFSINGDVTGNLGAADYWIVKLDASGALQWQKCLGGTSQDFASSIQQTTDGGYIIAGSTYSDNGYVSGNHSFNSDYWIVKLDGAGNLQWQKCLGGTNYDAPYSVQQTTDGGFIIAGETASNDGDVTGNHSGGRDYWIVKLDGLGIFQWQKCLGGTSDEYAKSIQQTVDGGFVVAGLTYSNNGDVTGNHGLIDYWVTKLDNNGNLQWQKCLGGQIVDYANSIKQTDDGGYIIAGFTNSTNGDVTCMNPNNYWIVNLDSSGTIQWQACYGGTWDDYANSIRQTADGGYIVAGSSNSFDVDVTGNHGGSDYWIVKLSSVTSIDKGVKFSSINIFPNPFTSHTIIEFGSQVYNATLRVYNLLGEKVIETKGINGERYDLYRGNLASDVYFFEITEKDKTLGRGMAIMN